MDGKPVMKRGAWFGVHQNQLLQLKTEDFAGVVATPLSGSQKRQRTPIRVTHQLEQRNDWVTVRGVQKRRQRSCKVCALLRVDAKKSFSTTFCKRCSLDDAKLWFCNKIRYDGGALVTRTVIPARPASVDQDDVDMADSESAGAQDAETASQPRHSQARSTVKYGGSGSAPSESSLSARAPARSTRTKSSCTSRSRRSDSHSPTSSGAAQVALNVMRQHQEAVAQLKEQQEAFHDRQYKAQLEMQRNMDRQLQGAAFEIRSLNERTTRAEEARHAAEQALLRIEEARVEAERRAQAAEESLTRPTPKTEEAAPESHEEGAARLEEIIRLERQHLQAENAEQLRREQDLVQHNL
uniref:Uncharacterized protein n=1 Tax=Phytophthora ramorum TaxID=164328 RepID=H3H7W7_PHYRM